MGKGKEMHAYRAQRASPCKLVFTAVDVESQSQTQTQTQSKNMTCYS